MFLNDNGKTRIFYNIGDNMHQLNINTKGFIGTGDHVFWDVIPKFSIFIYGDLTYFSRVMDQDGYSM